MCSIAISVYEGGHYSTAADFFKKSGTEVALQYLKKPELAWYVVGNVVSFGNYHENLEWHVLAIEGDKVLLGTTKYIDYRAMDSGSSGYDESDIYQWCNSTFIDTAFIDSESQMIQDSENGYVFLFSKEEREIYYSQGVVWSEEATAHAKALQEQQGNYTAAKWGWYRCDNSFDSSAPVTGSDISDDALKRYPKYVRVGMWIIPNNER